jgi:opacity protein-like surface antigen
MENTVMTRLKILTTAAALLVSLASAPVFAQAARTPHASPQTTYDNSGWNGYNNGGYNNTWFDGKTYRSDPKPLGEDIASDAAVR